jgi:hypothetical protein
MKCYLYQTFYNRLCPASEYPCGHLEPGDPSSPEEDEWGMPLGLDRVGGVANKPSTLENAYCLSSPSHSLHPICCLGVSDGGEGEEPET